MSPISAAKLAIALGLSTALVACNRPTPTASLPAPVTSSAIVAPFSINELMVMIVDHPGELLWNVEKDGQAPNSKEEWYQLESHAVELASAGTLIKLGGSGPNDMGWVKETLWQQSSQQLVTAALAARAAASKQNYSALIAANGDIVDACEACHKQFKPDIPTGGLFLHPIQAASSMR